METRWRTAGVQPGALLTPTVVASVTRGCCRAARCPWYHADHDDDNHAEAAALLIPTEDDAQLPKTMASAAWGCRYAAPCPRYSPDHDDEGHMEAADVQPCSPSTPLPDNAQDDSNGGSGCSSHPSSPPQTTPRIMAARLPACSPAPTQFDETMTTAAARKLPACSMARLHFDAVLLGLPATLLQRDHDHGGGMEAVSMQPGVSSISAVDGAQDDDAGSLGLPVCSLTPMLLHRDHDHDGGMETAGMQPGLTVPIKMAPGLGAIGLALMLLP
jgi:hypothetical protein